MREAPLPLEDGHNHKTPSEARLDAPLPERMRPLCLEDVAGQRRLLGPGGPLANAAASGNIPSCILYGPPGVGKTTIARLLAGVTGRRMLEINAVTANVASLRSLVEEASRLKSAQNGRSAIAFVDEIYHFNRQQQNVLLPSVESGELLLMGSTTENPYFEINKTLLSRMIVFELRPLSPDDILTLLRRALHDREKGLGRLELSVEDDALDEIAAMSGGDARQALIRLEASASAAAVGGGSVLTAEHVRNVSPGALQRYDRDSDDHYRVISALIKSMRGSDPDAAVYWLARLVAAGEDIRFIARRLVVFAAEDVGLADPRALSVAVSAAQGADMTGLPEARIILSEAVIYLAAAPKSNSAYLAVDAALSAIRKGDLQEVPTHLRPHEKGYLYPHSEPSHWVAQKYLNEPRRFYYPGIIGEESSMAERLKKFWRRFRKGQ